MKAFETRQKQYKTLLKKMLKKIQTIKTITNKIRENRKIQLKINNLINNQTILESALYFWIKAELKKAQFFEKLSP